MMCVYACVCVRAHVYGCIGVLGIRESIFDKAGALAQLTS